MALGETMVVVNHHGCGQLEIRRAELGEVFAIEKHLLTRVLCWEAVRLLKVFVFKTQNY